MEPIGGGAPGSRRFFAIGCHSRESGNTVHPDETWIPAFPGLTALGPFQAGQDVVCCWLAAMNVVLVVEEKAGDEHEDDDDFLKSCHTAENAV